MPKAPGVLQEGAVGSNNVIDLGELLTPVSEESPCGESLRWDPLYDEVKEARRDRRP